MRLAVIQPEQPHIGQKADHNRRMLRLKLGKDRGQQRFDAGDRGDNQFPGNRLALSLDPAGKLAKLFLGGLCHQQQIAPGLGRGVTARVALKQSGPQPLFQRVDMADHRGMVNAQNLGRPRNRPHPSHLIGGADLVPVLKPHRCAPSLVCAKPVCLTLDLQGRD